MVQLNHDLFKDISSEEKLYVFDLFHDLNEGIVLALLNHMIKKFTPIELTALIEKLDYLKASLDLPQIKLDGSKGYLKGTGVQTMNFFSIFSFINIKFLNNDPIYEQYIILRKIVNFLINPVVNISDLDQFDKDVSDYLKLHISNGLSVTPKTHHLIHYSEIIREFGPLIYYSTLRFERLHQIGKLRVINSRNKKNLSYSIIKAYVYNINEKTSPPTAEVLINKDLIKDEFFDFFQFIDQSKDLKLIKSITFKNFKIKTGNYYLYKNGDCTPLNYPLFFYVESVIKQETTKILGYLVEVDHFDRNKYAYFLKESLAAKELDKLPYYKKLNFVKSLKISFNFFIVFYFRKL